MAKIKAPNKSYTGTSAGVYFVNGEAETEDKWLIDWFKNKGYEVESVAVESEDNQNDNNGKPIEKMTHEELDAFAAEKGIPEEDYPKSENKDEKIAVINDFLSGE